MMIRRLLAIAALLLPTFASAEDRMLNLIETMERNDGRSPQTAIYISKRCAALYMAASTVNEIVSSTELREVAARERSEGFVIVAFQMAREDDPSANMDSLLADIGALTLSYGGAMRGSYLETGSYLGWDMNVDLAVCENLLL